MKKTWAKRLFSSAVALMMGLSLMPAGAFAAEGEITAPSDWANGTYDDKTKVATVTYTIPADADYEKINFPVLRDGNLLDGVTWVPGDSANIVVRVVDQSGKYSYLEDSIQVGTKELDPSNPGEVVNRAYNPALYELIEIQPYSASENGDIEDQLTDKALGALLMEEGYEDGIGGLDDYYRFFYQVDDLDQLDDERLTQMFSGRWNGSFSGMYDATGANETNEEIIYLGWKNLYRNLFTVDGAGILKYTAGSAETSALNSKFASGLMTDDGVAMTIGIDFSKTMNCYANHELYIDLGFSMEQTVAPEDKTSYPGLTKQVKDGDEWTNATSANANGEVSFQLTSNVPEDLLNYLSPEDVKDPEVQDPPVNLLSVPLEERGEYILTFHDQMDDMLVDPEDFAVTVNGTTLTAEQYTLTQTGLTNGCDFELSVDLVELYKAGLFTQDEFGTAPIVVTYNATLSENATAGDYLNKAWVVYEGGNTEESTVTVSTYQIKVYKFDQSTEAPLSGAEFTLTGQDGKKYTAVSGDDGYAYFNGLAEGVYSLQETKAPENYVASDQTIDVTIPNQATDNIATVNFANSPIPHTGGMGTTMFTVGGAAILAAAGALFVVSRRKETR